MATPSPVSPEEMNFGQLIAHISDADLNACAIASGLDRPELPAKIAEWAKNVQKVDVDKDTATQFLRDSSAFCDKAVAAMTPEQLDSVVGPRGSKTDRLRVVVGLLHTRCASQGTG